MQTSRKSNDDKGQPSFRVIIKKHLYREYPDAIIIVVVVGFHKQEEVIIREVYSGVPRAAEYRIVRLHLGRAFTTAVRLPDD